MSAADLIERLRAAAPKPRRIELPEPLGAVFVMPMTVADMNESAAAISASPDRPTAIAASVARTLCDDTGARFEVSEDLLAALKGLPWETMQTLITAAGPGEKPGNV